MSDGMGWVHATNYIATKWENDAMTTETTQRPGEVAAIAAAVDAAKEDRLQHVFVIAELRCFCGATFLDYTEGTQHLETVRAQIAVTAAYPLIAAAVLAEVVEELTNAGQLQAAGFVGRMTEQQA